MLGLCRGQIPSPEPEPVIFVPKALSDTVDFTFNLDASTESRAVFERPLNQVPQIVVVMPA